MGASQPAGDDAFKIERSLRLNRPDTATLSRTPSANGNRRRWTISYWWKQGQIPTVSTHSTNHHTVSDNYDIIGLMNTSEMGMFHAANGIGAKGVGQLRDVGAWYHLVYVLDTDHPLAKSRCRMYCNGKLQDTVTPGWGSDRYPNQYEEMSWNRNAASYIGVYPATPSYEDCLIADFHFLDGVTTGPSAFGEFDSKGVWNPKSFKLPTPNNGTTWSSVLTSETGSFDAGNPVTCLFNGILGQGSAGQCSDPSAQGKWLKFTPSGGLEFKQGIRVQHWHGSSSPYTKVDYTVKLTDGRIFKTFTQQASNDWITLYEGSGTIEYIQSKAYAGFYNNWGAIEVDGVMLQDGKTDITTSVNNGTTWSSAASGTSTSPWTKAFDSDFMDGQYPGSSNTTEWTPSSPLAFTDLRIWCYKDSTPGTLYLKGNEDNWVDVTSTVPAHGGIGPQLTDFSHVSGVSTPLKAIKSVGGAGTANVVIGGIKIDGQQLVDGVNTVHGLNGCHLKFSDNSGNTSTTIGKDSSGEGNNWTPNNISVTAGTGNDSLTDSPTSYGTDDGAGGEVRSTYCTWNPLATSGPTFKNGNLDVASATSSAVPSNGTFGMSSGKWYWEVDYTGGNDGIAVGITKNERLVDFPGNNDDSWAFMSYSGKKGHNATQVSYGSSFTPTAGSGHGTTVGIALDVDARKIWWRIDGTWQASGDPANGTNAAYTDLDQNVTYFPTCGPDSSGVNHAEYSINAGQRPFEDAAPSGFKCLCTANLPDPTIEDPSTVFDAQIYTGTGADHAISQFKFSPDFVWVKRRDATNGQNLFDQVRGVTKYIQSSSTNGEGTDADELKSFDSDGFTYGGNAGGNADGGNYVSWGWDAGSSAGSAKSGATGQTITASASWYNATSGFEVLKWSGTGSAGKIGHNLGSAPGMIIVKQTTSHSTTGQGDGNWIFGHDGLGPGDGRLIFNGDHTWDAGNESAAHWNDTVPTNELFGLGTSGNVNGSGATYIGYIWSTVPYYSSHGKYTGNNNANGPFIYTGFKPKWLLIKRTESTKSWMLIDTTRNPSNVVQGTLFPNENTVEFTGTGHRVDLLSNGFKVRDANDRHNASGEVYIYSAFAESPFKTARAA